MQPEKIWILNNLIKNKIKSGKVYDKTFVKSNYLATNNQICTSFDYYPGLDRYNHQLKNLLNGYRVTIVDMVIDKINMILEVY